MSFFTSLFSLAAEGAERSACHRSSLHTRYGNSCLQLVDLFHVYQNFTNL